MKILFFLNILLISFFAESNCLFKPNSLAGLRTKIFLSVQDHHYSRTNLNSGSEFIVFDLQGKQGLIRINKKDSDTILPAIYKSLTLVSNKPYIFLVVDGLLNNSAYNAEKEVFIFPFSNSSIECIASTSSAIYPVFSIGVKNERTKLLFDLDGKKISDKSFNKIDKTATFLICKADSYNSLYVREINRFIDTDFLDLEVLGRNNFILAKTEKSNIIIDRIGNYVFETNSPIVNAQKSKGFLVSINEDSTTIINPQSNNLSRITLSRGKLYESYNRHIIVSENDRFGVLNSQFDWLLLPKYDSLSFFYTQNAPKEFMLCVHSPKGISVIDLEGNEKLSYKGAVSFEKITTPLNCYSKVKYGKKYKIYDNNSESFVGKELFDDALFIDSSIWLLQSDHILTFNIKTKEFSQKQKYPTHGFKSIEEIPSSFIGALQGTEQDLMKFANAITPDSLIVFKLLSKGCFGSDVSNFSLSSLLNVDRYYNKTIEIKRLLEQNGSLESLKWDNKIPVISTDKPTENNADTSCPRKFSFHVFDNKNHYILEMYGVFSVDGYYKISSIFSIDRIEFVKN